MTDTALDTRSRLLDAAEDLFADRGFDGASVRDIAAAADVNTAAVNYHFQGKENLYTEVVRRRVEAKRDLTLRAMREAVRGDEDDLGRVIRAFFHTHFEDTLKTRQGANFVRLFQHELHHGHVRNPSILRDALEPMWRDLGERLQAACPGLQRTEILWITGILHGQLVHFTIRWLKSVRPDLIPGAPPADDHAPPALFAPLAGDVDTYIARATDIITRFSAAGVREVCRGAAERPLRDHATEETP